MSINMGTLSVLVSFLGLLCLSSSSASSLSSVSFSLTYIDAERSLLRSVEADPSDLPEGMPMRDFVAAGRAMKRRIEKCTEKSGNVGGKVSYKGEKSGDFYLTVPVGTPPQDVIFLVDTGSEFTWSQCSPCTDCTPTKSPPFASKASSSFLPVPCESRLCARSLGFTTQCIDSPGPNCTFAVRYGDESTAQGPIAIDTFHLGPDFSKPINIVFGCATIDNETVPTSSSGLMGLSAGPFSFTTQLLGGNAPYVKFAYCLPDKFTNLNATGTIQFGNYDLATTLRYTKLVPPYGPLGGIYYFVKMEGITVGGHLIELVAIEAHEKPGVISTGGTIFDSGSAMTSLVMSVYNEFVAEMRRQTAHLRRTSAPPGSELLCYMAELDAEEPPEVPLVTLHFGGGVDLDLGPESILYPDGNVDNGMAFCLAFGSTDDDLNIIGNYQQQNYWVEYNLHTFSLGLAKADCASL